MILVHTEGPIGFVTLDRAAARNAVPLDGWDRLAEAVATAAGQSRVIVLRSGVAGIFCAGADLSEFPAMMADPGLPPYFRRAMRRATDALSGAAVPVVAAIDGGCFGAGVALAMACDIRAAGRDAAFAIPPARLGISYPQKDVDRLRDLVGPGAASRLLLTGDRIDGAEAHRIRLVDILAEDAAAESMAIAERIAGSASYSVSALSAAVRGQSEAAGDAMFDAAFAGDDLRARMPKR